MPCHSLPYLDLSHWREEVTQCRVNGLDIELGSSRKISPCTSCTCTKEGVSEIFKLANSISRLSGSAKKCTRLQFNCNGSIIKTFNMSIF